MEKQGSGFTLDERRLGGECAEDGGETLPADVMKGVGESRVRGRVEVLNFALLVRSLDVEETVESKEVDNGGNPGIAPRNCTVLHKRVELVKRPRPTSLNTLEVELLFGAGGIDDLLEVGDVLGDALDIERGEEAGNCLGLGEPVEILVAILADQLRDEGEARGRVGLDNRLDALGLIEGDRIVRQTREQSGQGSKYLSLRTMERAAL